MHGMARTVAEKPAILQDQTFVVEEGVGYRLCRTGAIWMNKLFLSCLFLLAIWIVLASIGEVQPCTPGASEGSVEDVEAIEEGTCSVWLNTTSQYLGAMTILSFLVSLAFGAIGLMLGKRILEVAESQSEVGARDDE